MSKPNPRELIEQFLAQAEAYVANAPMDRTQALLAIAWLRARAQAYDFNPLEEPRP